MITIPVPIIPQSDSDLVERTIEAACRAAGLTITLKSTLSKFPGALHWHLKQGAQPGTLELTYWPARQQMWLTIRPNRSAPWVEAAAEQLNTDLQMRFQVDVGVG